MNPLKTWPETPPNWTCYGNHIVADRGDGDAEAVALTTTPEIAAYVASLPDFHRLAIAQEDANQRMAAWAESANVARLATERERDELLARIHRYRAEVYRLELLVYRLQLGIAVCAGVGLFAGLCWLALRGAL